MGVAVRFWLRLCRSGEPQLWALLPFTSEDIDFKGERDDVKRIADQLQRIPAYPRKVEMTALAGSIPFRIGDLESNIAVVRSIPGISGSVEALALQAEWAGKKIRVLDPISLLSCKLKLATTLSQEERRDVDHVKILLLCVRAFLREFLEQVERGELPEKGWLGATKKVLKFTTSSRARRAAKKFCIDWAAILPLEEISRTKRAELIQFRERQLPRWKPTRPGE